MKPVFKHNIALKKRYGQHFLRNQQVVDHMVEAVTLSANSNVLEIGPGDGFLTRRILQEPVAQLWAFEIDPEWAQRIKQIIKDRRLQVIEQDFLTVDLSMLAPCKPWIILANLPYNITFPILHMIQTHRDLFAEGVVMVQEEVAQRLVSKGGRTMGAISLFFQWYFEFKLLDKIPPTSFFPAPKVNSRLVYFKPKAIDPVIQQDDAFWKLVSLCFRQPRRTLRNNLAQTQYDISRLDEETLALRAQQLGIDGFLKIWAALIAQ